MNIVPAIKKYRYFALLVFKAYLMTQKQICYRLSLARKKAERVKEEIAQLNRMIKNFGAHPDEKRRRRRDREIFRLHKQGYSYLDIGFEVRLSAERVRQICRQMERTTKSGME